MAESWRQGTPVSTAAARTIADGVAVRVPVPAAVRWMRDVVDDVLLVDDEHIYRALLMVRDTMGHILEPSGAIGVAAMMQHDIDGPTVATIVTGSNFSADLLARLTGSEPLPDGLDIA
jgi:threonine dehydratase